jgi:hypothetical protein
MNKEEREKIKTTKSARKETIDITGINTSFSIITLNVNGLNSPSKRYRLIRLKNNIELCALCKHISQ